MRSFISLKGIFIAEIKSLEFAFTSGARENELGTNTSLIRALKYAAVGTITIHMMSCAWYSLACANEGAVEISCDASSWAMQLKTGRSCYVELY